MADGSGVGVFWANIVLGIEANAIPKMTLRGMRSPPTDSSRLFGAQLPPLGAGEMNAIRVSPTATDQQDLNTWLQGLDGEELVQIRQTSPVWKTRRRLQERALTGHTPLPPSISN
jgi:hypothetical protein